MKKSSLLRNKIIIRVLKCLFIITVISGVIIVNTPFSGIIQADEYHAITAEDAMLNFINSMKKSDTMGFAVDDTVVINKINQLFGFEAWETVSYEKIDGTPPYTEEVYILSETGGELLYSEYKNKLDTHVKDVCSDYSFNPQYLSVTGDDLLKLSYENIVLRNIIIQEISKKSPVKITTRPAAPYQYYQLIFIDSPNSLNEEICNIRIIFIKTQEVWTFDHIYYDPIDVYEGDI